MVEFSIWTILILGGAILLLAGFMKWTKKKDAAMIGGAILLGIGLVGSGMLGFGFEELAITEEIADEGVTPVTGCFPVESMKINAKNTYTQAAANTEYKLYEKGADVTDPDVQPLTEGVLAAGTATDTSYLFSSCDTEADKDLWMNGSTTYYDDKVSDWHIDYNPDTGKGVLIFDTTETFYRATPVGTLTNFDTADSNTSTNDAGTDSFTIDETRASGSFALTWSLGNSAANTEIHNMVLCFQDYNSTGVLEGSEITAIDISYVSGDDIDTKGTLSGNKISMFKDAAGTGGYICREIADVVGSNDKGKYEFSFTISEAAWAKGEILAMFIDDLGGYKANEYPSGSTKATVSPVYIESDT